MASCPWPSVRGRWRAPRPHPIWPPQIGSRRRRRPLRPLAGRRPRAPATPAACALSAPRLRRRRCPARVGRLSAPSSLCRPPSGGRGAPAMRRVGSPFLHGAARQAAAMAVVSSPSTARPPFDSCGARRGCVLAASPPFTTTALPPAALRYGASPAISPATRREIARSDAPPSRLIPGLLVSLLVGLPPLPSRREPFRGLLSPPHRASPSSLLSQGLPSLPPRHRRPWSMPAARRFFTHRSFVRALASTSTRCAPSSPTLRLHFGPSSRSS